MPANSGDPDQTPQYVLSDLDIHCLHTSHAREYFIHAFIFANILKKCKLDSCPGMVTVRDVSEVNNSGVVR